LCDADVQRIHHAALDALEKIGLSQAPPSGVEVMVAAGAIQGEDGRLRYPRTLVEDMLAKAARNITLPARDEKFDLHLETDRVHFGTAGAAVHMVDPVTKEYRDPTTQDLFDAARLVQHLDNIHFFQRPLVCRELTDNLELGFSKMIGKTYLNLSFFGRNSDNAINQVRSPIDSLDGTLLTTYENIGRERALGLNAFINVYLTKNWTINGGIDLDYANLEGQVTGSDGLSVTATNAGINYGGRLMSQVKLNNGWSAQAFTFMRGRRVQLQGWRGGFGLYALGVSKEFNEGKGTVGLSVENFATRGWTLRGELETATFSQVREDVLLNRNIKVTFGYKFGELDASKARKKTRGVSNDDLLCGGDDNGGGQAAPPQTRRQQRKAAAPEKAANKKTKKVEDTKE